MSNLLKIWFVVLVGISVVHAADFPPQIGWNTLNYNLLSVSQSTVNTNSAGTTNLVESVLCHTVVETVTTNGVAQPVSVITDGTIDLTNFFPIVTNSAAQTGGVSVSSFVGKYKALRVRTTTTNATLSVDYLGGR